MVIPRPGFGRSSGGSGCGTTSMAGLRTAAVEALQEHRSELKPNTQVTSSIRLYRRQLVFWTKKRAKKRSTIGGRRDRVSGACFGRHHTVSTILARFSSLSRVKSAA